MARGKLIDQPRVGRARIPDLAEPADSAECELIGQWRGRWRLIENGDDTAIEIHVNRLKRVEHPVQETRAVEVKRGGTRQVESHTRSCRLRASQPARESDAGSRIFHSEKAQRIRIAKHVVRASEVQPRADPGCRGGRKVEPGLHLTLAFESRIRAEDPDSVAACHDSERGVVTVIPEIAHRGEVETSGKGLVRLELQ